MELLRLGIAMAFVFVTKTMLEPLVPLLGLSLGASPTVVGALVAAPFLLPLFLAVSAGALVDRWQANRLIPLGAALTALAPTAIFFFPNLLVLAVVQVVVGLAHLLLVISAQTVVASLGSGRKREANFGRYTTFLSAGQLLGPLLAGVLADLLGYRAAFGIAGSMSLFGVVLSLSLPSIPREPLDNNERFFDLKRMATLLDRGGTKAALVISASVLFALGSYQAFFPVYLEELAYSATLIGILLSMRALAALTVRPFTARIIGLFRGRFLTALSMMLLVATGLAVTGLVESLVPLALGSVLIGIGWGITQPVSMVTVTEQVGANQRGLALSVRITANRIAQLVSPLVFGLMAEVTGSGMTFVVSALVLLVPCLWITRWRSNLDYREERQYEEQYS